MNRIEQMREDLARSQPFRIVIWRFLRRLLSWVILLSVCLAVGYGIKTVLPVTHVWIHNKGPEFFMTLASVCRFFVGPVLGVLGSIAAGVLLALVIIWAWRNR